MKPGDIEEAAGPFQCPFCTGTFSVSNPPELDKAPAILHTLPTCKEYDSLETLDDAIRYMQCTHN